ncbi:hypothetical protein LTR17_026568 [Elasticomyces elasticus]|nr:hypothetical protein LTR17_026568 [Elasticomyces elasticus]
MGKAGRIACITIPWALTVASFVCLVLIEIAGWGSGGGMLQDYYFMKANFTNVTFSTAGDLANTTTLSAALQEAKSDGLLKPVYQIHLWNYCTGDSTNGSIDHCTKKRSNYVFDPVVEWGLNSTNVTSSATPTATASNVVESGINHLKNNTEELENELLGKTGRKAMEAYRKVAKWMFIAYEISLWTTLATIVCSILAVFSRWGSFLTWIFAVVSSIFTFGSVLASTILFGTLTGALQTLLHPYGIRVSMGTHALAVTWLAVLFSWAATIFWMMSVCCCSGRSNPHHKNNKGGLWAAEPKGQGYGGDMGGRGRGMKVQKTGGGYERVSSPGMGHDSERVPLHDYPQQQGHGRQQSGPFEPFRR